MFKNMILSVCFVVFSLFVLSSCNKGSKTITRETNPIVVTNAEEPIKTVSPDQQQANTLKRQLDVAIKEEQEAEAHGNIIKKLTAEKAELSIRAKLSDTNAKIWEANAKSYREQVKEKDAELKEARIEAWKVKLWWMAGICGFLSIVSFVLIWVFPVLRPIASKVSLALAIAAGVMLFVAQSLSTIAWLLGFVPYVLAFGGVIAVVCLFIGLRNWIKDHKSLTQIIQGIEGIKDQIPNFSDHMNLHIDETFSKHIESYKNSLKQLVEKLEKKIVK